MKVDPNISFWLGVITTVVLGIGSGTVSLTHMLPDAWIPTITAWCLFIGFVNSVILTALHGMSSPQSGPLAGGGK